MKAVGARRQWRLFVVAVSVMLLAFGLPTPAPLTAGTGGDLFEELNSAYGDAAGQTAARSDTIIRSRTVRINLPAIDGEAVDQADAGASREVVTLRLFDDVTFFAEKRKLERRSANSYSWFGAFNGSDRIQAILTVEDGVMVGYIQQAGQEYKIRPFERRTL